MAKYQETLESKASSGGGSRRVGDLLNKFKQDLMADKKKAVILAVLACVLLVVAGRSVFSGSGEPAGASANDLIPPSVPVQAAAAAQAKDPLVRPEPQPISAPASPSAQSAVQAAAGTSAAKRESREPADAPKAIRVDQMSRTLHRNIFNTPDWSQFEPGEGLVPVGEVQASVVQGPSFWQEVTSALTANQARYRQEQQRMLEDLRKLQLQSTMTGAENIAYVSGRLVRAGDKIDGFSVVRIEEKHVTLERNGIPGVLALP